MKFLETIKTRVAEWVVRHTMSCHEVTRVASQSLDQQLPLSTRLKLNLHLRVCVWCQRYLQQIRFIRDAMPKLGEHAAHLPSARMTESAKEKIKKRLSGDTSSGL